MKVTVYVDNMYLNPMGRFGRMKMSHMIATSEKELHAMAQNIGIRRRWYQGDHYDISKGKRRLAVEAGAVEVNMKEMAGIRWCIREERRFTSPGQALRIMMRSIEITARELGI